MGVTPLLVALASSTPLTRELTPSWVEACNGTYLFSEDKKTWSDAYGECVLYGSHLVQMTAWQKTFACLNMHMQRVCLLIGIGTALMTTWQKEFGSSTTVSSSCGLHIGHPTILMAELPELRSSWVENGRICWQMGRRSMH